MLGDYNIGNYQVNEAYREIRTYLSMNEDLKTILITSYDINEGKTTVACGLAKCFADLHSCKTLLIDCDFIKKSVSKYLEVDYTEGIVDVISREKPLENCIKEMNGFDLLTAGESSDNNSAILESEEIKELLEYLKEKYDYILIDSPPISRLNDAIIISTYVDGTLIINASNSLNKKMANVTKSKLDKVNANVIGVILNKAKGKENKYYSYYRDYDGEKKHKFFIRKNSNQNLRE